MVIIHLLHLLVVLLMVLAVIVMAVVLLLLLLLVFSSSFSSGDQADLTAAEVAFGTRLVERGPKPNMSAVCLG